MHPPPSRLVLVYVGTAHLALLAAAALATAAADQLVQSFLFPRVLASVHLVTLGWLTATALGAVYALLPLTLVTPLRVRGLDALACAAVLTGSSGVVAHMLLASYSGLAWSGGTIAAGAAIIAARVGNALRAAPAPPLQAVTIPLALGMLAVAAGLGAGVALDHERAMFAAGHLRAIAAHAHLALVGWLLLLTIGVGHRLLPMLLPAHPVRGWRPTATVLLLAAATLALPAAWFLSPPESTWPALAALPAGLAVVLFALDVRAMRRRAVPRAKGLPRIDPALVLIAFGLACCLAALALGGLQLLVAYRPRLVAAYGVVLLLGTFGSLVLGVGFRLWPIVAWRRAFGRSSAVPAIPPAALPSYLLQWLALVAWLGAVLLLTLGVGLGQAALAWSGGIVWSAAALVANANFALVLVRARWGRRDHGRREFASPP